MPTSVRNKINYKKAQLDKLYNTDLPAWRVIDIVFTKYCESPEEIILDLIDRQRDAVHMVNKCAKELERWRQDGYDVERMRAEGRAMLLRKI